MLFGVPQLLSQLPHDVTFTLMEKELKPSATAKDLGITWDTRLTYDNHVTNIVSSSMKAFLQINRVRHLFSSEIQCIVQNVSARVITGT